MDPPLTLRDRLRFAQAVRDQLFRLGKEQRADLKNPTDNIAADLRKIQRCNSLCRKASEHGWSEAWSRTADHLHQLLRDLPYSASQLTGQLTRGREITPPSLRELFAELDQIAEEFPAVDLPDSSEELLVVTEPITLEGQYLGPFGIHLHLDRLTAPRSGSPLRIEALDPHPAGTNPSVTHPHVSDGLLCLGEAAEPLRRALQSGRLCDAMLIVRSVLQTYNPESPYVAIENWYGEPCFDCGYTCDIEDLRYCEHCGHDYCEECVGLCDGCEESACLRCLRMCPTCGQAVCPTCLQTCPDCGEMLCSCCREEHTCPCPEEKDHESHCPPPSVPARTGPAFQPARLGEAFVSA